MQVAHALAEDGGEHAPDLGLARNLAVGQQIHHAADALRLLDDEVHFQVKFTSNQLEGGEAEGEEEGGGLRAWAVEQCQRRWESGGVEEEGGEEKNDLMKL